MKMIKWCVYGALGTCSVLAALVAQPVQAAEQYAYFSMDAGVALVPDIEVKEFVGVKLPSSFALDKATFSMSPGFRFDLVGGRNLSETVALELEAGLLYNAFDRISVSGAAAGVPFSVSENLNDMNLWQFPVLVNVVYTFKLDSRFKPFLGAGAGGVFTVIQGHGSSEGDFTFAFQGMAGVKYELSDRVDIGVTYKFLGSLDHNFKGDAKTEGIYSHSLLAALTFRM